jgi:hypothetical protein
VLAHSAIELPEVSVALLGSTSEVVVKGLSKEDNARFLKGGNLLEPHKLTISLPDGKFISLIARSVSLSGDLQDRKILTDIYVRRPLEPTMFGEAVADLRKTLGELGIEPEPMMKEHLSNWEKDASSMRDVPGVIRLASLFKTGTKAFDKVHLSVAVEPDPHGGWFYLLVFGIELEDRPSMKLLRAEQAARAAATQPTTTQSTVTD